MGGSGELPYDARHPMMGTRVDVVGGGVGHERVIARLTERTQVEGMKGRPTSTALDAGWRKPPASGGAAGPGAPSGADHRG